MIEIFQTPLFINILILAASLFVLIRASDLIVFGISNYARKFGISEYLIGFVVVSVGMSTPEFISSLMGALQGNSGVVVGSFFGAVTAGILLILGVSAIIGKKISLESRLLRESRHYFFIIAAIPAVLLLTGRITRLAGIGMIAVFLGFVIYLWRKEGTFGKLKNVKIKRIWKDVFIFLGALIAMILAARWMVFSAVNVSELIGVSSYLIALLVIGVGSSLPDLTVQIRAIKTGHTHIAFGDILGSTLADMLLLFGIVAVISPVTIAVKSIILSVIFYLGGLALVLWLIKHREMDYRHGIVMVFIYFLFIALEVLSEAGVI